MPLTFVDRVRETWTGTGAGTMTLSGAAAAYQSFAVVGNANQCYYAIIHRTADQFEIGYGTVTTGSNNTLSRDTIIRGYSSGTTQSTAVNFSAGTKDVICTAGGGFTQSVTTPVVGACADMNQSIDISLTAGETINPRDVVYIDRADGLARQAQANIPQRGLAAWIAGFSAEPAAVTVNKSVAVRLAGIMPGFSSLTAGQAQYLSNTAGGITNQPQTNSMPVGIAISTTQVWVNSVPNQSVVPIVNAQKGYFVGGDTATANAGGFTTLVEKLVYGTGSLTALAGTLSQGRSGLVGISQGSYQSFFMGGGTSSSGVGGPVTTGDLATFATDGIGTSGAASLTTARQYAAGLSEARSKGYIAGGLTGASLTTNSVELLKFYTAATSALAGTLSVARWGLAGLSEGNSKGYFLGGDSTGAGGGITNTIDMVAFANDTLYTMTAFGTLSPVRRHSATASDNVYRGYSIGGQSTTAAASRLNNCDKLMYATDTLTNAITTLATARWLHAGQSGTINGQINGGETGTTSANTTNGEKLNFAPETFVAGATLTVARDGMGSHSDIGF